jgi:hypothetical protein
MAMGFVYVIVEKDSNEFLKVGRGKAHSRERLLQDAQKRLGKLQSCNVRTLQFARLFEFLSHEAAKTAEKRWHQEWRTRAGVGGYPNQEWYHWFGPAGRCVSPEIADEFMLTQPEFIGLRLEATRLSAAGDYLGPADATTRGGLLRQMRLHTLQLNDHGRQYWHLYGTSAPNELARDYDIASWWWTGNPRTVTLPIVLERVSFDPASSQVELGRAISQLRERFARQFAPAPLPSRNWPFALSWFEGEEAEVVETALKALGPAWRRHSAPIRWPSPV